MRMTYMSSTNSIPGAVSLMQSTALVVELSDGRFCYELDVPALSAPVATPTEARAPMDVLAGDNHLAISKDNLQHTFQCIVR
jgi:hypothetical protein